LVPWLAVLALLALPSNRNARAWWIWAPLVGVVLLRVGLEAAAGDADNEQLGFSVQAACAAAFGLAAIWLMGAGLARRGLAVSIMLMSLAFTVVSLLAFVVSPVWEQLWALREYESAILLYILLFWIACALVFACGLNLTGLMCRKRFSCPRVLFRLPFWLWVMWLVAGALLGCDRRFIHHDSFEWMGMLMGTLAFALVSFGIILPYLILSFTNSFYRKRLKEFLRLPTAGATPPVPTPSPVAELGSPP
jgi:hypothetical protein